MGNRVDKMFKAITNYQAIGFEECKYSYVILKPNAARHFHPIMTEIKRQNFKVLGCFAIFDYETVNMTLHPDTKVKDYIVPISRMYHDFYGNYAILVLLGKERITYADFAKQVYRLKMNLRARFNVDYVAYCFDTSKIGKENEEQILQIVSKDGRKLKMDSMNDPGTYMIFLVNEIHSPGETVEETIEELHILRKIGVLVEDNLIPNVLVESMQRYESFAFLKDM